MKRSSENQNTFWENLIFKLKPVRKQVGWSLIIISTLAWVGIGALFFLDISVAIQTALSSLLFIIGEVTFFGSIPFLGKDIWGAIKGLFKSDSAHINKRCKYKTKNLSIDSWESYLKNSEKLSELSHTIMNMLSEDVTNFLPQEWSNIDSLEKSDEWIRRRDAESFVFTIKVLDTQKIAGLLILTDSGSGEKNDLRLGFIFAKNYWGNGLAKEMIAGLIKWCNEDQKISSLTGGVESNNHASEKVLMNNGFSVSKTETPQEMKFFTRKFS
jgi:RimJ/RimL family protein N-acetyltransferase